MAVFDENAVGHDEVEVDVAIHQPAEPLDEGDGAGPWRGSAALAGDAALPSTYGADEKGRRAPASRLDQLPKRQACGLRARRE